MSKYSEWNNEENEDGPFDLFVMPKKKEINLYPEGTFDERPGDRNFRWADVAKDLWLYENPRKEYIYSKFPYDASTLASRWVGLYSPKEVYEMVDAADAERQRMQRDLKLADELPEINDPVIQAKLAKNKFWKLNQAFDQEVQRFLSNCEDNIDVIYDEKNNKVLARFQRPMQAKERHASAQTMRLLLECMKMAGSMGVPEESTEEFEVTVRGRLKTIMREGPEFQALQAAKEVLSTPLDDLENGRVFEGQVVERRPKE